MLFVTQKNKLCSEVYKEVYDLNYEGRPSSCFGRPCAILKKEYNPLLPPAGDKFSYINAVA